MKNNLSLHLSSCVDCNSVRKVQCLVVVSEWTAAFLLAKVYVSEIIIGKVK